MTDQNRKTLRHFQCRDYLWEIFTQMGQELECSVDYLVNESMRQYARSRNYGTRPGTVSTAQAQPVRHNSSIPAIGSSAGDARAPLAPPPPVVAPPPPRPNMAGAAPARQSAPGLPPDMPPPVRESNPPPLPGAVARAPVTGKMPTLFAVFNGQKIPVNKAEFVIGRGSKTADLPIRDGNISRRHCAVVLVNNEFFMKDLGSTNGVEFDGRRIDTKKIEEGDLYQICDYEIRFTYR